MLMTGLQEVDWSKLTGPRRPSPHTTETSRPTPVLGLTVLLLVVPSLPAPSLTVHGKPMSLMLQVEEDWDGFRNISWFTTTALTWDASLRVPLLSANRFVDEPFLEIYDVELWSPWIDGDSLHIPLYSELHLAWYSGPGRQNKILIFFCFLFIYSITSSCQDVSTFSR